MDTLANKLRQKKSLEVKNATLTDRAIKGAVTDVNIEPDFNTEENISLLEVSLNESRNLKAQVALTTSAVKVRIPEDISVPEAGQEVSLLQAILIRDDLKRLRGLLTRLCDLHIGKDQKFGAWGSREVEVSEKVRRFDFSKVLARAEALQPQIDKIDALIQYTDNTV